MRPYWRSKNCNNSPPPSSTKPTFHQDTVVTVSVFADNWRYTATLFNPVLKLVRLCNGIRSHSGQSVNLSLHLERERERGGKTVKQMQLIVLGNI